MSDESNKQSVPPPSDRRIDMRHLACFPAHVESDDKVPRTAIIRDLSVTGAMLLTRAKLVVGDRVKLSLYITGDAERAAVTEGQVVRAERWGDGSSMWPLSVGVHFDKAITDHELEIRELEEIQKRLGLPR